MWMVCRHAHKSLTLTHGFSRASSMESKRTLVNPERSLDDFWHHEYPKYTSMKVCINFQISIFLGSGRTPGFSRASSKESKRFLVVPERSLGGFRHNEYPKYTLRKVCINFQISTFLGSGPTLGLSRASSKESKRTLVAPERSLGGFWHNEYP